MSFFRTGAFEESVVRSGGSDPDLNIQIKKNTLNGSIGTTNVIAPATDKNGKEIKSASETSPVESSLALVDINSQVSKPIKGNKSSTAKSSLNRTTTTSSPHTADSVLTLPEVFSSFHPIAQHHSNVSYSHCIIFNYIQQWNL